MHSSSTHRDIMRDPVAPLVCACYLFAQCAVTVCGMGCFNPADPIGNRLYYCTMRLSSTADIAGHTVAAEIFNPSQDPYELGAYLVDQPFLGNDREVFFQFDAAGTETSPACLHLEKVELSIETPHTYEEIDRIVLRSFEGGDPATQRLLGEHIGVNIQLATFLNDYGGPPYEVLDYYIGYESASVFVDISCEGPQTTEQFAFEVEHVHP